MDVHAALGTLLKVGSSDAVAVLIKLQFAVEADATETCQRANTLKRAVVSDL